MFGLKKEVVCSTAVGMVFGFGTAYLTLLLGYDWQVEQASRCALLDMDVFNVSKLTSFFYWKRSEKVASRMRSEIRVLCWIATGNLDRVEHILATWGRKCTRLVFFGPNNLTTDDKPPVYAYPVNGSWDRMSWSLKFIYLNFFHGYDWFLRVDDTSYVVMENLRMLLATRNSYEPIYIGCAFFNQFLHPVKYASEAAGFVLSSAAMQRLVVSALPWIDKITHDAGLIPHEKVEDDIKLAWCLKRVNIYIDDSKDYYSKERFHPMEPFDHLLAIERFDLSDYDKWNKRHSRDGSDVLEEENNCCSDTAITFHDVTIRDMYIYEYFLYRLRPYGILFY